MSASLSVPSGPLRTAALVLARLLPLTMNIAVSSSRRIGQAESRSASPGYLDPRLSGSRIRRISVRLWHGLLKVFLIAPCLVPRVEHAQRSERIDRVQDTPSCKACRIVVTSSRVLEVPALEQGSIPIGVREDSKKRTWIFRQLDLPLIYDVGKTQPRVLGRRGNGPNEYRAVVDAVSLPGDSILIVDAVGGRSVILDPQLQARRYVAGESNLLGTVVLGWPDAVVTNAAIPTPTRIGLPLHRVSFKNSPLRMLQSFGGSEGELRPNAMQASLYSLTRVDPLRFWAGARNAYRIELWTRDGTLERTLVREPAWFQGVSAADLGWSNRPPPPNLAAIDIDRDGLIWAFVAVPAPAWREAWPKLSPKQREVEGASLAIDRLFDTMVEVLDPTRNVVVSRARLPGVPLAALSGRRMATYQVTEDGRTTVTIRALDVRQPTVP